MAENCAKNLHIRIQENLHNAKSDSDVKEAIKKAFVEQEEEWLKVAKITFDKGFATPAYCSSTALIAIVRDGKLYVANAGDSKAVLLRSKTDGSNTYE